MEESQLFHSVLLLGISTDRNFGFGSESNTTFRFSGLRDEKVQ
jgi:hypothetical protein